MSVYTLKMNILDKPNSFQYCKENGMIGIGWGLKDSEKGSATNFDELKPILRSKYNAPHLTACLNTMNKMGCGDYIWTVDISTSNPTYYLCELTSDYQCFDETVWRKCGVANGFRCTYHAITTDELIPSGIIRYLNAKGLIFEIEDTNEIAATESIAKAINSISSVK